MFIRVHFSSFANRHNRYLQPSANTDITENALGGDFLPELDLFDQK